MENNIVLPPVKNFFAIISSVDSPETATRELETLNTISSEFFVRYNPPIVPCFIHDFFISKFVHLINSKPSYKNCGRILLNQQTKVDYSLSKIKATLKFFFDKPDADCSFLFLSGHGSSNGDLKLYLKEGEGMLSFRDVKEIWEKRATKETNKELFILIDSSYSGKWVLENTSPNIFIQSSCSHTEKAKDFVVDGQIVGSIFLHNFLMVQHVADCFYEVSNQSPLCTNLSPDQGKRISSLLEMDIMKKNWKEFVDLFTVQVRSFNKNEVIYDKDLMENESVEQLKKTSGPDVKKWGLSLG